MKFIDREYYLNVYTGKPAVNDNELDALIERASFLVDSLAAYRISAAGGLEGFLCKYQHPVRGTVESAIKDAVACETEYLLTSGGGTAGDEREDDNVNVKIGGFSYSKGSGGKTGGAATGAFGGDGRYPKSVYSYLERAGLLNRGCDVI